MEISLKAVFEYLYIVIGTIGFGIIVWGVVLAVYRLITLEFRRFKHQYTVTGKRHAISMLRISCWHVSF